MEILQMLTLKPSLAIMDETDSGLDIDALRDVSKGVNKMMNENFSLLVITHYERILEYLNPKFLHILMDGRVVLSGGPELVKELEEKGYDWVKDAAAKQEPATV
jgi:Fe-S cluster assembly ATP-binding protein